MRLVLVNNYKEPEKAQEVLRNLTRCTEQPVEVVDRSAPDLVRKVLEMKPDLVFLSGSNSLLTRLGTRREYQAEMDLVSKANFPVLGICFGHQLIGTAFGSGMTDLGEMIKRFEEVRVLDKHPIFDGLPSSIEVAESHRQVLDRVPAGFMRLAESETSPIEAMCHETKPIYSFQFHPERADEIRPHGRMIIQNLLKLAKS
jgi:GMP synthase-like glutamine amidotransferase